jgi:hypothetical protein
MSATWADPRADFPPCSPRCDVRRHVVCGGPRCCSHLHTAPSSKVGTR